MTNAFTITDAVAQGMLNGTGFAESLGASPKLRIYAGTAPANADAALAGNTQLAELVMAATPLASFTTVGSNARATAGAIAPDSSADATGAASFFRILDNAATTTKCQGSVGVTAGSFDLVLNTVNITLGSTVTITSATFDLPKG